MYGPSATRADGWTDLENLLEGLLNGEGSLGRLLGDLDLLNGVNNGLRSSVS